jgi:hypothetical protein
LDATDPSNTGSAPANNTAITTWKDKSGNGNDVTSSGTNPLFKTAGLATGMPSIYYDGAGAHLSGINVSGPYTLAFISRLEGSQSNRVVGDYTGQNILFGYWNNQMHGFYINGAPENLFGSTTPVAIAAAATKNNYIFTRAGASGAFTFYNSGTQYATNPASSAAAFKLQFGCGYGAVGECSKVHISEVLLYNRVLTPSELTTLNTYFSRWGF